MVGGSRPVCPAAVKLSVQAPIPSVAVSTVNPEKDWKSSLMDGPEKIHYEPTGFEREMTKLFQFSALFISLSYCLIKSVGCRLQIYLLRYCKKKR